jgi:N-acetylneuraminic acid mutarotase
MTKLRRFALSATLCLPLALLGCGGSSGSSTNVNVWNFVGGGTTANALGSYGSAGVAGGQPGARTLAATWADGSGRLWMFGGNGYAAAGAAGELSDLWRYDSASGQWTWVSGATSTGATGSYAAGGAPGARDAAQTWTDGSGNFWMYGGHGVDGSGTTGMLGDLWEYTSTGGWAFVGGSQAANNATNGTTAPGSREAAATWVDSSGHLWMFGGNGYDSNSALGALGDFWEYSGGKWVLKGGSTVKSAAGSWGTQGQAAAGVVPSARYGAAAWVDASGRFWLFGGYGLDSAGTFGELADLWMFDPTTSMWTWVAGASTAQAAGSYGSVGLPASTNAPGARAFATTWRDASGNLWMFGGFGLDGYGVVGPLNDLWEYSVSTSTWIWVSGSNAANAAGVFSGTGIAPGARYGAAGWTDSSGRQWFFGGSALGTLPSTGPIQPTAPFNDLWNRTP